MASWWDDFWNGKTTQIGSPSDVTVLNQGDVTNWQNQLKQLLGGLSSGLGFGTTADGGTGTFDPTAAMNAYLSQQPGLAKVANQNVTNALSDVYSSGRSQAQAAADTARRQAASDLAAAGLLRSGAGVGSMTKATATPMMEMETSLANLRSNAFLNQLGQLQGQTGSLLGQGYQTGAGLLSQILGETGQMNQPQYYTPQYQQGTGFGDILPGILSAAASIGTGGLSNIGSGITGLLGQLFPKIGGATNNYAAPGYGGSQWAVGWRGQ